LRELVRAGATVVGRRPTRSPSLSGYPGCDAEIARIAEELWGDCDGRRVTEHRLGAGRVVWGRPLGELLASMGAPPDSESKAVDAPARVSFIHRSTGGAEIYFVASAEHRRRELVCTFRIAGREPELWRPDTGRVEPCPVWRERDGRTEVPLRFDPAGSVFVVFRRAPPADHFVEVRREGPSPSRRRPDELVIVEALYGVGAGSGPRRTDVTEQVRAMVERGVLRIPATNAMAGGDPAPNVMKELRVDFAAGGARASRTVRENQTLELPEGAEVARAIYGVLPPEAELVDREIDITNRLNALIADGSLDVAVTNELAGSDPAYGVVKRLRVRYLLNGVRKSVTVSENQRLVLPPGLAGACEPPAYELAAVPGGELQVRAWVPGRFAFTAASGRSAALDVSEVPPPTEVEGPWVVRFPPGLGAPESVELARLASWTEHQDPGVRYFSGTATYTKAIDCPRAALGPGRRVYLDLGGVKNLARVRLNGTDLGCLWKPPFRLDATDSLRPGANRLEIAVTNLWPNRLIGDEQFPDDCEWSGDALARWPDWLVAGRPRPEPRRVAFATWKHWRRHDELLESGLIGPVRLEYVAVQEVR